jgi:hypothetical protein
LKKLIKQCFLSFFIFVFISWRNKKSQRFSIFEQMIAKLNNWRF